MSQESTKNYYVCEKARQAKRRQKRRIYGPSLNTHHGNVCYALRSQAQVATLLGISPMRVSQLERQAMMKLRVYFSYGESW